MSRLGLTMADLDSIKSNGSCLWSEDEDGNWHTECSQMHIFFEGGPVENFYKYCPYCGKFLSVNIKETQDEKLGDQWIEVIDGKEHMVKAVKPINLCQGCCFNCNQGGCYWRDFDDCGMGSRYIIKDLGVLRNGMLPCPFCGFYPDVVEDEGEFCIVCNACEISSTYWYKTVQQAIDAWNRRV